MHLLEKIPEGFNPLESSWYKDAVKADGEIIVSSPYKSKSTGNMVIAIAKQNADKKWCHWRRFEY